MISQFFIYLIGLGCLRRSWQGLVWLSDEVQPFAFRSQWGVELNKALFNNDLRYKVLAIGRSFILTETFDSQYPDGCGLVIRNTRKFDNKASLMGINLFKYNSLDSQILADTLRSLVVFRNCYRYKPIGSEYFMFGKWNRPP